MLEPFAKLYETQIGQILVKLEPNDQEQEECRILFKPEGLGVCSIGLSSKNEDPETADEQAREYYKATTEESAVEMVKQIVTGLGITHGG